MFLGNQNSSLSLGIAPNASIYPGELSSIPAQIRSTIYLLFQSMTIVK
jgi:hypothetical protein